MSIARKIFGKRIFESLMRGTFYGQFIAGQDSQEVLNTVNDLKKHGVFSTLNYSAEGDLANEMYANDSIATHLKTKRKICEKYFNDDEIQFDLNLENYLDSIQLTSG